MDGEDQNRVVGGDTPDESTAKDKNLDLRDQSTPESSSGFRSKTGNVAEWGKSPTDAAEADTEASSAHERWRRAIAEQEAELAAGRTPSRGRHFAAESASFDDDDDDEDDESPVIDEAPTVSSATFSPPTSRPESPISPPAEPSFPTPPWSMPPAQETDALDKPSDDSNDESFVAPDFLPDDFGAPHSYSPEDEAAKPGAGDNPPSPPPAGTDFPFSSPFGPPGSDPAANPFNDDVDWDFGDFAAPGGTTAGTNPYTSPFEAPGQPPPPFADPYASTFETPGASGFDDEAINDEYNDDDSDYDDFDYAFHEKSEGRLQQLFYKLPGWAIPAGLIFLSLILALTLKPILFGNDKTSGAETALKSFWVAANADDGESMHKLLCSTQAAEATPQLLTESFARIGPVDISKTKAGKEQDSLSPSGEPIKRVTVVATATRADQNGKGTFNALMVKEGNSWKYCGPVQTGAGG